MLAAHISRQRLQPEYQIAKVDSDQQAVIVDWLDGHQSTFHTLWLRDNCSCDQCGNHSGGQRHFELDMLPDTLANEATVVAQMLQIEWTADGHITSYDPAWLRSHCHLEYRQRRNKPVLWDASISGNIPEADYSIATNDQNELLKIYDSVRSHGLCLLKNGPATPAGTEEIAGLLSFVRETHYGRVFEIVSSPNPSLIANAPVPLRPHTDENFREPPPGIMIFHSIQASEDGGGESVMTDGFKLAADFMRQYTDDYQLLTTVPIPHRRFIENVGLRAEAPMISLDYFGDIIEFRLNERTMGPLDLPVDLVASVYEALAKMYKLSYDSKYHMKYLLQAGEVLVFDNARVLHARTGFNGNRHVRLTHVGSDEFYSRWRQLRHEIHGDINLC